MFPLISLPGQESLDAAGLVADQRNVLLMVEGGGFILVWHEPAVYEIHSNFLKGYRGAYALQCCLAAVRWMFTHTDCMWLLTQVPKFNVAARRAAAFSGATLEFERNAAWPTNDGSVPVSYWSLRYDDWVRQTPGLADAGHWFHEHIEAEFVRHGVVRVAHPDEECHDRQAGACIEMIRGGQSEKAVILYNRWARFAGYHPIALVARDPLIIDIGDAVIQVTGDDFKALVCRGEPAREESV